MKASRYVGILMVALLTVLAIGGTGLGTYANAAKNGVRFVPTPAGYAAAPCVLDVGNGANVHSSGNDLIIDMANHTRLDLPIPCPYPSYGGQAGPNPITNGWVEDADWQSSNWIQTSWAYWNVPNSPTCASQTLFFFNALEPSTSNPNAIIQPVLQWGSSGAGGGCYWGIASWWGDYGYFIHSSLVQVNQNDQIFGYMHYVGNTQYGCCWWYVQASDTTSGVSSYLNFQDAGITFYYWAFGGALEAYNLSSCDQYPSGSSGQTSFTSITLYDGNNHQLTPSWNRPVNSVTPQCSFTVTASTSSVTLTY